MPLTMFNVLFVAVVLAQEQRKLMEKGVAKTCRSHSDCKYAYGSPDKFGCFHAEKTQKSGDKYYFDVTCSKAPEGVQCFCEKLCYDDHRSLVVCSLQYTVAGSGEYNAENARASISRTSTFDAVIPIMIIGLSCIM